MKKYSMFLFLILLVFGTTSSVQAVPLLEYGDADPYVGVFEATSYDYTNINAALDDWNNEEGPPDLPLLPDNNYDYIDEGSGWPNDYEPIELSWSGTYQYLTIKYDGLVDLFYVAGLEAVEGVTTYTWYNDYQTQPLNALSHARLWNSIPEPATMLLLGSGLILLTGFGRKRFKSE
jgi:hypothetical protein